MNADFTEENLRALYDANPDSFDQVTVRHVLILSNDGMSTQEQRAASALTESIFARLNAGEDIEALAIEYSGCWSRHEGGELLLSLAPMATELEQWSFNASMGDTGIVKTQLGYHIVQMVNRATFDELDIGTLEMIAQNNVMFELIRESHSIHAYAWQYNQTLIDQFMDLLN